MRLPSTRTLLLAAGGTLAAILLLSSSGPATSPANGGGGGGGAPPGDDARSAALILALAADGNYLYIDPDETLLLAQRLAETDPETSAKLVSISALARAARLPKAQPPEAPTQARGDLLLPVDLAAFIHFVVTPNTGAKSADAYKAYTQLQAYLAAHPTAATDDPRLPDVLRQLQKYVTSLPA